MYGKLLFIFYPLFFVSCVSVSTINIQVLEPATYPVTTHEENIVILNRMIFDEPANEVSQGAFAGEFSEGSFNRATTEIVYALAGILNESPGTAYIDNNSILEMPGQVQDQIPAILDPDLIIFLCDSLGADAVMSLESFIVNVPDNILIRSKPDNRYGYYYVGELIVDMAAFWRTYKMPDGKVSDEHAWFDTLIWQHAAYNTAEIPANMPEIDEILMEAAYLSALEYARRSSPYWITQERYFFFRGNRTLKDAANDMDNGLYENARLKYESLLDNRNKNLVSAAAFNLSLLFEIGGDYRLAYNWARRSYQDRKHPITEEYIETLELRLTKSDELDRQLGRIPLK